MTDIAQDVPVKKDTSKAWYAAILVPAVPYIHNFCVAFLVGHGTPYIDQTGAATLMAAIESAVGGLSIYQVSQDVVDWIVDVILFFKNAAARIAKARNSKGNQNEP